MKHFILVSALVMCGCASTARDSFSNVIQVGGVLKCVAGAGC